MVMELAFNLTAMLILTALTARLSLPTPSVSDVFLPPTECLFFLPRSASASKASLTLTVFAQPAQMVALAAPAPLLALNVLSQPPTTMMDLAAAQLDTTSPLPPSDTALNALNTVLPALLPMLPLLARLTSPSLAVSALAPLDVSSTAMDNVLLASMAANHATAQTHALFATPHSFSKNLAASADAQLDTTNQASLALSALLDALPAAMPMSALSAKPVNSPITVSAMLTALQVQLLASTPHPALLAMLLALPALSTPASAPAALPAAALSSTSSA